ncbi:MAG: lamin tail domain-containing protein, partial [Fidelibacterota bacterium]
MASLFAVAVAWGQASDLFISEYSEGTSYNKYIEIFNGTGSSVNLANYRVWKIANGGSWPEKELTLSGTLASNDVYVVAHSSANSATLYAADVTWGQANWNGDDAVGLAKYVDGTWTLLDAVGTDGSDPGSGWAVAGVSDATVNHTLVRKSSVSQGNTDWPSSAGTNAEDSGWIVYDKDTFDYLGSHTFSSGEGSGTTIVQFSSSSASVFESTGTYDITVSISHEDADNATSVQVVLTGGTAINGTDISVYTTQTVTFPAGSAVSQTVAVTIADDSDFEGSETGIFQLQNASGGNSAQVGGTSQFTLTIQDNDAPNIVINEIHADPDGTAGDANGDGSRSATEDEFVEVANNHGSGIDISGWTLSDNSAVRHTFPGNTVLPNGGAIVVFGGGTPAGSFGNSIVQTASEGQLSLNNGGDSVVLKASNGTTVTSSTYGSEAGEDQSITRDPDITGSFVEHTQATGASGARFSPGTKINGSRFIGATIDESSGGTAVTEGGATDSYTVKLESQPVTDVTVTVSPDDQTGTSPASLTFTSSNYSVAQTVTVTAVDDGIPEGSHISTISHSAGSGDDNYNGISIDNVTVTITDNDVAGVTLTESGGSTVVSEGGTSDNYTIVLNSAPSSDVTVTSSVADGEVGVHPGSLTFTSLDYLTAQTVTVTAVDDDEYEGNHSTTVTHTATSDDANYDGITIASVTVTVGDNDIPNMVINEINYDPVGSEDTYEFIELYNADDTSKDISGFSFTSGITYTFPASTAVDSGEYIVLANTSITYSGNGYQVFDWGPGGLNNSGESIVFSTASSGGLVVDEVTYNDTSPWPTQANGGGRSLELIDPFLDNSVASSWRASSLEGGTPGLPNSTNGVPAADGDSYVVSEDNELAVAAPGILANDA